MFRTMHYWRVHGRVAKRVLLDCSTHERTEIATPDSDLGKWFAAKVEADTLRLYEDPNYYDNSEFSFRVDKYERA